MYLQLTGQATTLKQISQDPDAQDIARVQAETWLHDMASILDLKRPLEMGDDGSPDQRVSMIVDMLFSEFPGLTLEDFYVHLRRYFSGGYGKTYHSLNDLLPTLREYQEGERRKASKDVRQKLEEQQRQSQLKQLEEARKDPETAKRIDAAAERCMQSFRDNFPEAWQKADKPKDNSMRAKLERLKQAGPTKPSGGIAASKIYERDATPIKHTTDEK